MSKILIIEDEKTLAQMYKEVFTKEGYDVFLAGDVAEALKQVKKVKPDLILLDILLPGETGISFLIKLRRLESEVADTNVVAFSNYDDQESKKEAFRLDAKEYLIKTENTPKEILNKSIKYLE
ncbi:MAG: response regulator [Patescibacteria group bacterium]